MLLSIRQNALDCPSFRSLLDAYSQREEAVRALGSRVVYKLGSDVPDEVLIAGGLIPVQLSAPESISLAETDEYLEPVFDPATRRNFARIISGDLAGGRLAIANSTDAIIRLFFYLREIRRVEPAKPLPEMTFLDILFTRNRLHQQRNEQVFRLFRKQAEAWAGRAITDDEIREAGRLCNENRAVLRQAAALRRQARISGSEAQVIVGSALFMERGQHTRLAADVVASAADWPVIAGPRLFYTGSDQESTDLYVWLEQLGTVIVGDDQDWGERFYDRDFDLTLPVDRALADRYMLREFSSKKSFVSQRTAALGREVDAAGAEAVLFFTQVHEDASSWDYPSQKKMLDERSIPSLGLFRTVSRPAGDPALAASLERFIGSLARDGAEHGE